ncbi:hypothetical protein N780_03150 [Pontibacillus chungwhensis BH030062]|uniref:Uncharacterized protein n=1 Tax=Pontibacillus chungwhensis BH030062 TaxID=1385513 RepID=A0A0A2VAT4_9BACI|nr:hypothetical protein N780_03150 [Pontibacillus chungwhensis BH030062]
MGQLAFLRGAGKPPPSLTLRAGSYLGSPQESEWFPGPPYALLLLTETSLYLSQTGILYGRNG